MNFGKHWAAVLDDYAIALAWAPDGTLLAAASATGGITLFDAATGAVRHRLPGHDDGTNCLAWMPEAQRTEDRGQKTELPQSAPAKSAGSLSSVACPPSPVLLATGGQDGCVRFWDAARGVQVAETKLGTAWVEHLVWVSEVGRVIPAPLQSGPEPVERPNAPSPDAETERRIQDIPPFLLFAAAGRKLVVLRPDGSVVHTFPDAPKTISALAATPSFNFPSSTFKSASIAAACFGHVVVWDAATFAARKEYAYGNTIHALTWSPDGRWLVAGCQDNAVHLWVPGEDLELHGYETKLRELSFSPDSRWLATGGGRDACVWDCSGAGPEGREPQLLPHTARVGALAYQSQGLLASGSVDGTFTLWAPTRKNPMIAEVKMPAAATTFAWSLDGAHLAVGTEKGQVFVFRLS